MGEVCYCLGMLLPLVALALLHAAPANLTVRTLDGKTVPFANYTRDVTVVAFWGTFCAPCVEELPHLEALHERLAKEKGVAFVAVSVDPAGTAEERAKVAAAAKRLGLHMPVVLGDPSFMGAMLSEPDGQRLTQFGLPALVVMDKKGNRHRELGYQPEQGDTFEADHARLIAAAQAGKLPKDGLSAKAMAAEDRVLQGDLKGALKLFQEAYAQGTRAPRHEYNAACAAARLGEKALAFTWLSRAVEDGLEDAAWLEKDEDLASLHGDPRFARAVKAVTSRDGARLAEEGATDPALQKELLALVAADQATRAQVTPATAHDRALWARIAKLDRHSTARMKAIIKAHGWPGTKLVGATAEKGAWLLVQHADHDRPFQRRCLALLKAAVKTGDAAPEQLAYLTDRLLVADGKPQRYGTQFYPDHGEMKARPIEDPTNLDARRKAVGLTPFAQYREQMTHRLGAPPVAPGTSSH